MTLYDRPVQFSSLKDYHLYGTEWAADTFPGEEFQYHLVSKRGESNYLDFGKFLSLAEAFSARRTLAAQDPNHTYFLRASRRRFTVTPSSPESGEDRDLFRDAFRTGRDELIPAEQWGEYQKYVAARVSARQAYARIDRDAPRWD